MCTTADKHTTKEGNSVDKVANPIMCIQPNIDPKLFDI